MVADIDAAARPRPPAASTSGCADSNGLKVVEALKRAAARGVTCRAMADDLGSRAMIRSEHWQAMADGRRPARAARCRSASRCSRPLKGRIDMRNHRKIVVIDNRITYCGSQNCADAAFAHQGEATRPGSTR